MLKGFWDEFTRALGWLFPPDGDSGGEWDRYAAPVNEWDSEISWDEADGDAEEVWTDWLGFESDED